MTRTDTLIGERCDHCTAPAETMWVKHGDPGDRAVLTFCRYCTPLHLEGLRIAGFHLHLDSHG